MRYKIILFLILVGSHNLLQAQSPAGTLQGTVSFVSSQSVYIKFKSTSGISSGDTLFIIRSGKRIPALKVNGLSSVSCVTTPFPSINLAVGQGVVAYIKKVNETPEIQSIETTRKDTLISEPPVESPEKKQIRSWLKQRIGGSISAYSYSNFSNSDVSGSTQYRYNISLDAQHIANSRLSFNTYTSFRYDPDKLSEIQNDLFSALKVYSLSLGFDASKTTHLTLGRTINPKIASLGAMDGLQLEQSIKGFSLGILAGFRPDNEDYSLNTSLFQYGAYLALNTSSKDSFSETSVAVVQQMNNSKTDRRFLYFQHSNSFIKKIYFLSTFEVDLYKLMNDLPENTFDPTGLYLYLNYKMTKNFSISGSYDARKNITYYETYKTYIDRLIENEMRQSFRLQADYRITGNMLLGVQSGYRYLKSDPLPSRNIYAYFSYYQIPGINISTRLSGTYLESSYVNSKIFGINASRDLFKSKLNIDLGYLYVENMYPENTLKYIQNIYEANIAWFIFKKTSLSANYEGTFEKQDKQTRLFLQIRQRF